MTIGIYSLYWEESELIYIGQSKNIEKRIYEHIRLLSTNSHYNKKLTLAYTNYGNPTSSIIEECSLSDLDKLEIYWINEFNSIDSGLNILPGGNSTGKDTEHSASVYSKEELLAAAKLLLDSKQTLLSISNNTGISSAVLSTIANETAHTWILDTLHIHGKLKDAASDRRQNQRSFSKNYGAWMLSPTGKVFQVFKITDFAKEHDLTNSKVSEVLSQKRSSHKGWKLYKEST